MGIELGASLVHKWKQRFGLGHLRFHILPLGEDAAKKSNAQSYYDLVEEWAYVWLPDDEEFPPETLELLVLHELAHGVLWEGKAGLEQACDRIARIATRDYTSPWPGEWLSMSDPDTFWKGKSPTNSAIDRRKWLNVVADALPEEQREVISMHYIEGLGYRRIAERLGTNKDRVARVHAAALRNLRLYFDALDKEFHDGTQAD